MSILKQFSIYRIAAAGLLCLPLMVYAQTKHTDNKKTVQTNTTTSVANNGIDYKKTGAPLPKLRIVTPSGKTYNNDNLNNGGNLFVMMFNPSCEHCEDMTDALEKNITLFKQSNILLVAAPTQGPYLDFFINGLKTNKYPQLKIGLDSSQFIEKTFNYVGLPQINIYGSDRKLLKTLNGTTTIDSLKPFIQ